VLILADDLGWADINSFDPLERTYYETPRIDELAAEGVKFTQAYANAANCAPTRAALLSGQYYPNQPIYHVGSPSRGKLIPAPNARHLPPEKITLAEALKRGGYTTGFIGKWHIGNPSKTGPKAQGFEVNIGGYMAGNPGQWKGAYHKPNDNPYINDARDGEYLTDYLSRKAVEFIEEHRERPFYLQPNAAWRTSPVSVVRSGPWKLMKFYEDNGLELYNLQNDFGETDNLAESNPAVRDRLHRHLQTWLREHNAPMPQQRK
jgi:arylsulfatase A-like enzyme